MVFTDIICTSKKEEILSISRGYDEFLDRDMTIHRLFEEKAHQFATKPAVSFKIVKAGPYDSSKSLPIMDLRVTAA